MLEEELELNEAISEFTKRSGILEEELEAFLERWATYSEPYDEFSAQVAKNLAVLNVKLLNELSDEDQRFHLVKALCITVRLSLEMKSWDHMLGRADGAQYWNKYGLFFFPSHPHPHAE